MSTGGGVFTKVVADAREYLHLGSATPLALFSFRAVERGGRKYISLGWYRFRLTCPEKVQDLVLDTVRPPCCRREASALRDGWHSRLLCFHIISAQTRQHSPYLKATRCLFEDQSLDSNLVAQLEKLVNTAGVR